MLVFYQLGKNLKCTCSYIDGIDTPTRVELSQKIMKPLMTKEKTYHMDQYGGSFVNIVATIATGILPGIA